MIIINDCKSKSVFIYLGYLSFIFSGRTFYQPHIPRAQSAHDYDVFVTILFFAGDVDILKGLLAYAEPDVPNALYTGGRHRPPLCWDGGGHTASVRRGRPDGTARGHPGKLADAGGPAAGRGRVHVGPPLDGHRAAAGIRYSDDQGSGPARLAHRQISASVRSVAQHDHRGVYGTPLHVAVRHRRYRMMATCILSSNRCSTAVRHGARLRHVRIDTVRSQRGRRSRHASVPKRIPK